MHKKFANLHLNQTTLANRSRLWVKPNDYQQLATSQPASQARHQSTNCFFCCYQQSIVWRSRAATQTHDHIIISDGDRKRYCGHNTHKILNNIQLKSVCWQQMKTHTVTAVVGRWSWKLNSCLHVCMLAFHLQMGNIALPVGSNLYSFLVYIICAFAFFYFYLYVYIFVLIFDIRSHTLRRSTLCVAPQDSMRFRAPKNAVRCLGVRHIVWKCVTVVT